MPITEMLLAVVLAKSAVRTQWSEPPPLTAHSTTVHRKPSVDKEERVEERRVLEDVFTPRALFSWISVAKCSLPCRRPGQY